MNKNKALACVLFTLGLTAGVFADSITPGGTTISMSFVDNPAPRRFFPAPFERAEEAYGDAVEKYGLAVRFET